MLHLLDITSKIRTVAMFVIVTLDPQTCIMQDSKYIYDLWYFHTIFTYSAPVVAFNQKDTEKDNEICMPVSDFLSHIISGHIWSGASVASASQHSISPTVLLQIVGNSRYKFGVPSSSTTSTTNTSCDSLVDTCRQTDRQALMCMISRARVHFVRIA